MRSDAAPLIVQYLYVHQHDEAFSYPTARSRASVDKVAQRYLECALTQAATLRLREVDCELALATNVEGRSVLGRGGCRLLERIESLGVRILATPYRHRPADNGAYYVSSRYVLDAILSATEGQPPDRQLWFIDLDCVWPNAAQVLAAAPEAPQIGCIFIPYPPEWVAGITTGGSTRSAIGKLAEAMGAPPQPLPPWVGGELLTGTAETMRRLVRTCEELDARLAAEGRALGAEEEILTLAGALGRAQFRDLSDVARRIMTGPRHGAPPTATPLAYGLWHLPGEKGLSLRRTAHELMHGHEARLRRDLADPPRIARRFNVQGSRLTRRIRDDSWIAAQRVRDRTGSALSSARNAVLSLLG